ncbi:L,D-transpeptidase family protein [Cellulosilyticum sp. I15G10I2]|uniref:L,D-transpeptidase family protein n=1 Tax=Cellulosilyticum sp. I15G10I2 TaxID=1892843 RepID=UPI000A8BCF97|nr:L,D-transpeptidase family protein [Cellulosilyticum sp. I15G10I2]
MEKETESPVEEGALNAVEKEGEKAVEGRKENIVEKGAEEYEENRGAQQVEERGENKVEAQAEKHEEKGGDNEVEVPIEDKVESLLDKQIATTAASETEELADHNEENAVEHPVEKAVKKPKRIYKMLIAGIISVSCTLIIFYLGMTVYFINHFYFGSEINGINVSGKSVEAVEELMMSDLQNYRLDLKERGGKSEQIKAGDVGLSYESDEAFNKLKEDQNPLRWIVACFDTKGFKMTAGMTYDEKLLRERIDRLYCFNSAQVVEPKNPSFQYVDNKYVIVDEIPGNKIDKALLYTHIEEGLLKKELTIDLEQINCYIAPQYHSKSQEILEVRDALNKYVSSKVTYTFGNSQEVLEGNEINKWLIVDENFCVTVDEKMVEAYINGLSEKYDAPGRIRNFAASSGAIVQIGGGDFLRPINKAEEIQKLISVIKEGQTLTTEPVYGQTILSYGNSDIGHTYVEIDLTNQHIWFYKNGMLIVSGDIVTGNVRAGHTTPKGVYSLKYKVKNAVLRGPGYAAPVNYWMPFNGGIGIHDANWRSVFGGNIYKTDGSHGCINCPNNIAKMIYDYIEPGTPVICY